MPVWSGRVREAVEAVERAISNRPTWYLTVLGSALFVGEEYESVIDALEPLVADGSADREARLLLAAAQEALGMRRSARATLASVRAVPNAENELEELPFVDRSVVARWQRLLARAAEAHELDSDGTRA